MGLAAMLLLIACSSFQLLCASDDHDDAIFYESFDETFEIHWILSEKEDYNGEAEELATDDNSDFHELIEKGEKQPNITIGILVSIVAVFLTIFFKILFGGKNPARVKMTNTKPAQTSSDQSSESKEENKEKKETSGASRQRSRREN